MSAASLANQPRPTRRPWYAGLGRLPRPVWLLLAGLWAALIWQLSSGPIRAGLRLPFGRLLNNLAHGPAYAVLAGSLIFALPRRSEPYVWPSLTPARGLAVLCLTLAYGCVDEWHQLAVPGRSGCWPDLATDLSGGLLAWAAIAGLGAPQHRRSAVALAGAFALVLAAALFASYGPALPID